MAKTYGIAEILNKISAEGRTEDERQRMLTQEYKNQQLVLFLKYCFDPNIEFILPPGAPPYKKNEYVDQQSNFYADFRRLYLFMKGGNDALSQNKRESLFVQYLEGIDKDDAEMVIKMKDKQEPAPGITYDLVFKTFPGLLPEREKSTPIKKEVCTPSESSVTINSDKKEEEKKPCPFGCVSSETGEMRTFRRGPLVNHLRVAHIFTPDQISNHKKEVLSNV